MRGNDVQFKTEQEAFWAGQFGTDYSQRNTGAPLLASNLNFFANALQRARNISSCIEFGANIGMNLAALKLLLPGREFCGIEINTDATRELQSVIPPENVFQASILEFEPPKMFDLVLIKGVLIHINPEFLPDVYERLYRAAGRYILLCEYYNPSPVEVTYRGHQGRLFKRDFAGEMLERYGDLALIDYGFAYRRDPNFPQDDITWFLMEKKR